MQTQEFLSLLTPQGVIRTQELLDHETTPHYWLTVYAMDRGVAPLSAFVEVYVQVQDVNDNAPQTSEPVYYPSVMESSPKDVSIIKISAVDPDDKAGDKLTYRITSGNPQGFFAINTKTGKTGAQNARCNSCPAVNRVLRDRRAGSPRSESLVLCSWTNAKLEIWLLA